MLPKDILCMQRSLSYSNDLLAVTSQIILWLVLRASYSFSCHQVMWHVQLLFLCWFPTLCFLLSTTSIFRIHHTSSITMQKSTALFLSKLTQIICCEYYNFLPCFHWLMMPDLFYVHTWSNKISCCNIYFWLKFSQIVWSDLQTFYNLFQGSGHQIKWKWLC